MRIRGRVTRLPARSPSAGPYQSIVQIRQEVEDERISDRHRLDVELRSAGRAVELTEGLPLRVRPLVGLEYDAVLRGTFVYQGFLFPVAVVIAEFVSALALDHPRTVGALD